MTIHRSSEKLIRDITEFSYSDCTISPDNERANAEIAIEGKKGERLRIGTEELADDYIKRFGSWQWRIQCPRLSGKWFREFSMRVAGDAENESLSMSGSYELMPSEGSKRVQVNRTCKVTQ